MATRYVLEEKPRQFFPFGDDVWLNEWLTLEDTVTRFVLTADLTRDGEFISLPAMLSVVTDVWYGKIDETEPVLKVALVALMPFLLLIHAEQRLVHGLHLSKTLLCNSTFFSSGEMRQYHPNSFEIGLR